VPSVSPSQFATPQIHLQLPWAPILTPEEVQQGTTFYGGGARLRRVAAKLLAGQPVKVVTLGGSVTYGHGVEDLSLSYPSRFFQFIKASFPHRC
jgi:palmitoyltransferase